MIAFSGIDVVLNDAVAAETLRHEVAEVLSADPERVSVIDDIANYPESDRSDVVCVVSPAAGAFKVVVSIQCAPRDLPLSDKLQVAERLSSALKLDILAPSDDPNPYLMWLMQPAHPGKRVYLDAAALDEGRYEISRSAAG